MVMVMITFKSNWPHLCTILLDADQEKSDLQQHKWPNCHPLAKKSQDVCRFFAVFNEHSSFNLSFQQKNQLNY